VADPAGRRVKRLWRPGGPDLETRLHDRPEKCQVPFAWAELRVQFQEDGPEKQGFRERA